MSNEKDVPVDSGAHDDQVDVMSGGWHVLTKNPPVFHQRMSTSNGQPAIVPVLPKSNASRAARAAAYGIADPSEIARLHGPPTKAEFRRKLAAIKAGAGADPPALAAIKAANGAGGGLDLRGQGGTPRIRRAVGTAGAGRRGANGVVP